MTYTGCTQGTAKVKCKSIKNPSKTSEGTEGAEEEIITNTVEGELGTILLAQTSVRLLNPSQPTRDS